MISPPDPPLVAVAGDWHGDTIWAAAVVDAAADAGASVVVQVGDFGFDGLTASRYLDTLQAVCEKRGMEVWWVDGNHEDHPLIIGMTLDRPGQPFPVRERVFYLPRGQRWTWHGRTWVAVGGAASVDRALRIPGVDWWPEEELTDSQASRIAEAGPADVMVCHDVPAGVPVSLPPWRREWDLVDLARSDAHRARLQRVVDVVQPKLILHGHLHMAYAKKPDMGWGSPDVICLDRNRGSSHTWILVDPVTLEWRPPDPNGR